MSRRSGSAGLVVLLVVMAVVLLLARKAVKATASAAAAPAAATAGESASPQNGSTSLLDINSDAAGPAPANGPILAGNAREVRDQANANAAAVNKTLAETP